MFKDKITVVETVNKSLNGRRIAAKRAKDGEVEDGMTRREKRKQLDLEHGGVSSLLGPSTRQTNLSITRVEESGEERAKT